MKPQNKNKNLLIDKFKTSNLIQWRKYAGNAEAYELKLFYYLEGLRAVKHKELCSSLLESGLINLQSKSWHRCIDFKFSDNPLSAKGSLLEGGRLEVSDSKCNTFLFIVETERNVRWKQRDTVTYVRANAI